jgi:hypothetical protein
MAPLQGIGRQPHSLPWVCVHLAALLLPWPLPTHKTRSLSEWEEEVDRFFFFFFNESRLQFFDSLVFLIVRFV